MIEGEPPGGGGKSKRSNATGLRYADQVSVPEPLLEELYALGNTDVLSFMRDAARELSEYESSRTAPVMIYHAKGLSDTAYPEGRIAFWRALKKDQELKGSVKMRYVKDGPTEAELLERLIADGLQVDEAAHDGDSAPDSAASPLAAADVADPSSRVVDLAAAQLANLTEDDVPTYPILHWTDADVREEGTLSGYYTRLEDRLDVLEVMPRDTATQREALLQAVINQLFEIENVSGRFHNALYVDAAGLEDDDQHLPFVPSQITRTDGEPVVSHIWIPAPWIGQVQKLLLLGEAAGIAHFWYGRLGCPRYRNQTDNAVAGEATCAVTTAAMVMERVGFTRSDVTAAIRQHIADESCGGDVSVVTDAEITALFEAFLEDFPGTGSYGGTRSNVTAKKLYDKGSMEDLIHVLIRSQGTATTALRGHWDELYDDLHAGVDAAGASTFVSDEQAAPWTDDYETDLKACLDGGGSAVLSFHHKGEEFDTSSHIVAVVAYDDDGVIIEDPYGDARDDYRQDEPKDAYMIDAQYDLYAAANHKHPTGYRRASDLRNVEATTDTSTWFDTVLAGSFDDRSRGSQTVVSWDQLESGGFFKYMRRIHRNGDLDERICDYDDLQVDASDETSADEQAEEGVQGWLEWWRSFVGSN